MKTVVIMPGGFHPFHAGHLALYQQAKEAFPNAEVFVAATNDTSERPFPFAVKEKLAKLAGVSPNRFYQVKSPFRAEEITKNFDPNTDQLIFVRSEKDANKPPQAGGVKKDGSPAYLQPLMGAKQLEPFARHAYMAYLPTVEFGPGMTSATEIRRAWPQLNDRRKTALVMSLYPRTQADAKLAATVVRMLDVAILGSVQENQGWAATYTSEQTRAYGGQQGAGMTAAYQRRENQPVDEDYIEEKWSEKYKNSINCANPRGFSQRAHCAGRRKNESVAQGAALTDNIKHDISATVNLPKWQIGLPVYVKHLGQKGIIDSMSGDTAIVSVGMRQHRVKLSDLNRYPSKGMAEGLDAEAYKEKLLATLPQIMRFYAKNVKGWRPSREQMLAAVETGYTVMKHTGDVQQAGQAVMDELNTLYQISKSQQGMAEGSLNEYRDRLLQYVKSLLPTWPEYVLKDWLVPNKGDFSNLPDTELKNGIMEKLKFAGLTPDTKWQLVPNMKFTMDMFEPLTTKRLIGRAGGHNDMGLNVPRDKERHATQAALAQQQGGVRKEPVLLIKTANGYELLEGWHRTIQHFAKYPNGYTGPAYVAVAQGRQGVAEAQSAKTGIYQTDVMGAKAYHAKCMEPNCGWESKRFDRIKQAQASAEKHAKSHFEQGVAEGRLQESAIFLNPQTVIVGQEHGKPLNLSPQTLKKVKAIAAEHGAWYEGNGADRAFTKGVIDNYVGSFDDDVAKIASPNDPKWLYVLFANVDANNRVQRVGVDPKDTIFNRLLANATDNSFQGIGFTSQALKKFLEMSSEGKYDFVKMSQQPATQENLTRFLKAGEALMWPSNWEQYPNRAGKIAKAATVDARDQYLASRESGVYVVGSGHLKAIQQISGKQGVAEGVNDYLWHGSREEHNVLYPRQAVDTGGAEGSNKNAVYATPNAKFAIAMGLTTPGSDTGMFPNDSQMVLFSGKLRKGEYVYLHKVPKDLFIKHNGREWYSKPDVKEVKPIEIVKVPVDKYLNLIRSATEQDWKLRQHYLDKAKNKEQGVAEEQLAEKCWDTHRQAGMKKKGGRMVPNCVPKNTSTG